MNRYAIRLINLEKSRFDEFLETFNHREETIIRHKFGIGAKPLSDIEIVKRISKYSRLFSMQQLKRHYKAISVMVLDRERRDYGIIFDFAKPDIYFTCMDMRNDYALNKALNDLFDFYEIKNKDTF